MRLTIALATLALAPVARAQSPAGRPDRAPHAEGPQGDGARASEGSGQEQSGGDPKVGGAKESAPKSKWAGVPAVLPTPRYGDFYITPSGPGYYSAFALLTGDYQEKPPRSPYGSSGLMTHAYFDADYRYLEGVPPEERRWVEWFKRVHFPGRQLDAELRRRGAAAEHGSDE